MNKPTLKTFEQSDAAWIKDETDNILITFNEQSMSTKRKAAAVATYDGQKLIGGIYFRCYGQSAVIDSLAIVENRRRHGIGVQLLEAAEKKLRDYGCHHVTVETMEHQAPDFYRRHGYKDVTAIPDYYDKNTRFILRKILTGAANE